MLRRLVFALLSAAACGYVLASESEPSVSDQRFCAPDGVALGGYDVVSYWQPQGVQPGDAASAVEYQGLTYRFANEANRAAFQQDAERYLPTYQGWCSTNLAHGRLACPDYANYQIEDGRLVLFEQIGFSNGRDVWNADPDNLRARADRVFQRFLSLAQ